LANIVRAAVIAREAYPLLPDPHNRMRESGRMTPLRSCLVLLAVVLAGCAPRLVPAPGAQRAPGAGTGAVAELAGVRVIARTDAWSGRPLSLPTMVTPVLVSVENLGPAPIRIRREHFALVAPDGRQLVARGPYEITGVAVDPAPTGLAYPRPSVGLGLGISRGYALGVGFPFYGDPFLYDDYYYPMQVRIPLPTVDMVAMALPEKVIEPGERAEGFVYFERVPREVAQVDLTVRAENARTGEALGTIAIPFVRD
jgi:hypothetical protein